jgi:hypothetical protein
MHALAISVTGGCLQSLARVTVTLSDWQTISIMLYLNENTLSKYL